MHKWGGGGELRQATGAVLGRKQLFLEGSVKAVFFPTKCAVTHVWCVTINQSNGYVCIYANMKNYETCQEKTTILLAEYILIRQ